MSVLERLDQLLIKGYITEKEHKEKTEAYVNTVINLYVKGVITKDELYNKLHY